MSLKILNILLAIIIAICNIPLLISNFEIIKTQGGPMGIGLIASPILFICNLFLIPAILSFLKKNHKNKTLLTFNILGFICCMFFAFLYIFTPKLN
jgi:uncharacterized membrane protein YdfJ with MMPL/SSD domain